jgi:hypothetical protein
MRGWRGVGDGALYVDELGGEPDAPKTGKEVVAIEKRVF